MDIDAAENKDINISGGQLTLSSKDNVASAISLTTDVGTSETIVVTNTQGEGESAITLTATAGGVKIDAAAAKDVNISGGQVALVSKDNAASAISLTTNQGTSETIVVTNTQGEGEGAIALTATAGGITMKVADEKELTMGNATGDAYFKVAASATAGNEDLRIVNTNGTDEAAIAITSSSGGVDIDAAAGKDVNISGGQLTLSSKTNEASAISLTTDVGTSETIVVTNTQGTSEDAIALTSTAGGVDINAAKDKNVNIAGGQVALVSKDDAVSAISLTTNQGTSETIVITNTQGTDNGSIALISTAGGITNQFAENKSYTIKNANNDLSIVLTDDDTTVGNEKIVLLILKVIVKVQ